MTPKSRSTAPSNFHRDVSHAVASGDFAAWPTRDGHKNSRRQVGRFHTARHKVEPLGARPLAAGVYAAFTSLFSDASRNFTRYRKISENDQQHPFRRPRYRGLSRCRRLDHGARRNLRRKGARRKIEGRSSRLAQLYDEASLVTPGLDRSDQRFVRSFETILKQSVGP